MPFYPFYLVQYYAGIKNKDNLNPWEVPTTSYDDFVTGVTEYYNTAPVYSKHYSNHFTRYFNEQYTGGTGGATSFTVAGDNGTPFTIVSGDTLQFVGQTGIDIGVADPEVRIAMDYNGADSFIMAATNGTSITVDGANDKLVIYDNDASLVKYINANQLPGGSESYWSGTSAGNIVNSGLTNSYVGIGTTDPNENLTVKGSISATTNLYFGMIDGGTF